MGPRVRPDLHTYQQALFAAITGQNTAASADDASALVVGDERATAAERLHVYEHMYRARLVEALEAEFPRLARRVGADAFAELVVAYVGEHPSRHPSLRFLGQHLPAWLSRRGARADAADLGALARLERTRADVFDEADDAALTLESLRALATDDFAALPLALVAATRLVDVNAAALEIRDEPEATAVAGGEHRRSALVWREGVVVYHRALDDDEAAALRLIAGRSAFGAVCDALAETSPPDAAAERAFRWLWTWVSDGVLRAR